MATIQLGALITSIKGSIQGWTFQKSGTRSTVRARSSPGRSSTINQQLAHQTHQKRLNEWQALNLSDRQLWNSYASLYPKVNKFGTSKKLTGQNWLESINTTLELIGEPLLSIPPVHILPIPVNSFYLTFDNGYFQAIFDTPIDLTNDRLLIWGTPITSRTTLSVNQMRKYMSSIGGGVVTDFSLQPSYEDTFPADFAAIGTVQNKQIIICFQTVNVSSGITSPLLCSFAELNPTPSALDDSPFYYYQ